MRSGPLSRSLRTGCVVLVAGWLAGGGVFAAERAPDADVHFELGARALRQGETQTAVTELGEAARQVPDDAMVLALYAQALLAADEPKRALSVLGRLGALDPSAPDLAFMQGLAHVRLEEWIPAVSHLEVARSEAPDSARVRLFLGLAYAESGSTEKAEKEFSRAIELDPALQNEVVYRRGIAAARRNDLASARSLFELLQSQAPGSELARSAAAHAELLGVRGERPWNAFASLGVEYDSNVNLAGEDGLLSVSSEDDFAAVFQLGIDGVVLDSEPFLLRLGYAGFLSAYREVHDFDIEANSLFAEATYSVSESLSLELDYELDWVWADWDSFRRTHAIEPAVNLQLARGWLTRPFVRYEDRTFFTEAAAPEQDADGTLWLIGADQYWFAPGWLGQADSFVRAGVRYRSEDADGSEFDARGFEWVATLGSEIPFKSYALVEVSYERRNFREPSVFQAAGNDREDRITRVWVGLRRPLTPDFSAELSWRYTHWKSNVDVYDFDQSVTGFRLWYDF